MLKSSFCPTLPRITEEASENSFEDFSSKMPSLSEISPSKVSSLADVSPLVERKSGVNFNGRTVSAEKSPKKSSRGELPQATIKKLTTLELPTAVMKATSIQFSEAGGLEKAKKLGFFKVKIPLEMPPVATKTGTTFAELFSTSDQVSSVTNTPSVYQPTIDPFTSPSFKDKLPRSYWEKKKTEELEKRAEEVERKFTQRFVESLQDTMEAVTKIRPAPTKAGEHVATIILPKEQWERTRSGRNPSAIPHLGIRLEGVGMRIVKKIFEELGFQGKDAVGKACHNADRGQGEITLSHTKFQRAQKDQNGKLKNIKFQEAQKQDENGHKFCSIGNKQRDKGYVTVHLLKDAHLEVKVSGSRFKIMPEEGYVIANFGKALNADTAPVYRKVYHKTDSNYIMSVNIAPSLQKTDAESQNSASKPHSVSLA